MAVSLQDLKTAFADHYRIEREIGAGGMATVYLARDLKHDRQVALKVMRPELAAILGGERFLHEITIAAKLNHPHILALYDAGQAGEFLYYVMPYVDGESLRAKLEREKQLSVDEAIAITEQVSTALDYAHEQGVIHRDIKPENILIHQGEALVADFGIALALSTAGGNRLTDTRPCHAGRLRPHQGGFAVRTELAKCVACVVGSRFGPKKREEAVSTVETLWGVSGQIGQKGEPIGLAK